MMETALKLREVTKNYEEATAINNISFEIKSGKIVGLVGPNASGKTTLMKMIAGLVKPSSGEVLIYDKSPGIETKEIVAFLPDTNFLLKWMKVKDAIDFFVDFYRDFDKEKAMEMIKKMELKLDDVVKALSKGMQERLHLALILSRSAKIYILDEPLGGIDPISRDMIIETIISNFNEESTMLISTHIIRDIEKLFDEVIFIKNGEIVLHGETEELRMEKGKSIDEFYREVFKAC